jgi:hypothetical protein
VLTQFDKVLFSYWNPRALDKLHGYPVGAFYFKEEKFKMKTFVIIALLVTGLIWLVFNSYANAGNVDSGYSGNAPAYQAPVSRQAQTHEVVYQIIPSTCINFDVTYEMPGGTSQKSIRACPGKGVIDQRAAMHGDFLYLSAQNTTDVPTPQSFSCSISVDGEEVASVQSAGFASIASCDARIQ